MTRTKTDDAAVKGSQISTIRISFEDLKQIIRARQDQSSRKTPVLRISPSWGGFDEVETATIAWRDPATFYPDGKPHIDLQPGLLYGDKHPTKGPELAQYPNRLDQRGRCRKHHGLDENVVDMGDLWDRWWDNALTVWESHLKSALRDEVDLYENAYGPNVPSVTVAVEWTDLD